MNKSIDALKPVLTLALEALELYADYEGKTSIADKAIAAVREALASKIEALASGANEQPAPSSHLTDEQKAANGLAWLARLEAMREKFAGLAEQPAQQPVCKKDPQGCWSVRCQLGKVCKNTSPPASPSQGDIKPWVGLTDEDLQGFDADAVNTARYWEAKLKEKNGF